jgi:tripartite ATP-independent transporter DctP family solute receptor
MMKLFPALAAAICLFAVEAQAETVIKLAYTLPADSVMGAGAHAFAAEIHKALAGKYRVEEQPASKLGGDADVLKGVKLGTIEMTLLGGGGAISNVVPETSVLDMPFLFRDLAHAQAVLDGPIGDDLLAAFPKYGLVGLAWGEQGMRQITNSKKPIQSIDDLKGLKLRTPQSTVYVATFKALGAEVSPMPWPEVYPALQSGRMDGQENPTPTAVSAKLYEVQKYLSLSSHIYSAGMFVISPDVWAEVKDADKPAFIAAAKAGGKAMREFVKKAEAEAQATLRAKGVAINDISNRDAFVKAVEPVYASLDPALAAYVKRIRAVK